MKDVQLWLMVEVGGAEELVEEVRPGGKGRQRA